MGLGFGHAIHRTSWLRRVLALLPRTAPGTHEEFIAPLWKQSVGSIIHYFAGDATGIIVAATITSMANRTGENPVRRLTEASSATPSTKSPNQTWIEGTGFWDASVLHEPTNCLTYRSVVWHRGPLSFQRLAVHIVRDEPDLELYKIAQSWEFGTFTFSS